MSNIALIVLLIAAIVLLSGKVGAASAVGSGSIRWQSCLNSEFHDWFEQGPPYPELRCGYLETPLQYQGETSLADPQNRQRVRLALTLLPAKGARKGSLVTISGGPGLPGIDILLSDDWPVSRLRESWDIVNYDPRGVGRSIPKIACPLAETVPLTDDVADAERWARQKVAACLRGTGAAVLQHIGTHEAVSDLDRIRQALGEQRLTAVGWSYGTKVAAMYAVRFPERTRALVLDGVVDLAEDDYAQRLDQARGFQQSFERFASWCAQNGSCPLPADRRQALAYYRALLNRLQEKPLPNGDRQPIDAEALISLTNSNLLWQESWPLLASAIRQFDAGIVSAEVSDALEGGQNPQEDDALTAISCADYAMPGRDLRLQRRQQREIAQAAAFADFTAQRHYPRDVCDFWPWPGKDRAAVTVPAKTLPPLLFVAQRYDPTTPWNNARAMADAFHSPLITQEGDGHTLALSGSNLCVNKRVVDYLLNPEGDAGHDQSCL